MNVRFVRIIKVLLFSVIFFALSYVVAFFLRDDANSYARIMMHEFYCQDNVDVVFCGASHVSHGVDCRQADEVFGATTINLGTPSQQIDGTYIMLKQATRLYDIKKAFVELDFAAAQETPERQMGKADFIIMNNMKDLSLKYEFLRRFSPRYYLNALLPIGKDKFMTLNPKDVLGKLKSIVTGKYFQYVYEEDDAFYAGRGCVMDKSFIERGTFSNTYDEGPIRPLDEHWKKTIDDMISLCREKGIELVFYQMPSSDFYLNEKGNYDEFYFAVRNFIHSRGYEYHDFNLARKEYLDLEDEDFFDDNHLNERGIPKWTSVFCNFIVSDRTNSSGLFHGSYGEKMDSQEDRIFGLVLKSIEDPAAIKINPITNHVPDERITYDVFADFGDGEKIIAQKTQDKIISLPQGTSGNLKVVSYVDGVQQNLCSRHYSAY